MINTYFLLKMRSTYDLVYNKSLNISISRRQSRAKLPAFGNSAVLARLIR